MFLRSGFSDHTRELEKLIRLKYKLCKVKVQTSQIMDHLVHQSGGYMNVGFTKKDLYNRIDMDHKSKMRHGDAEGALAYLYAKKEMKLSFYFMITRLTMKPVWRIYILDRFSKSIRLFIFWRCPCI